MFLIYDNKPFEKEFNWSDIYRMDPNRCWATHFYNRHVLAYISRTTTDMNEKFQAEKEIKLADRKMQFWERISDFDLDSARDYVKNRYGV